MKKEEKNPATVMVVDDDEVFLEEMGLLLTESGYGTVTVKDPSDAANVARKTNPEVVLLDLNMPTKNGFDVAHEIQQTSTTKDLPIIAISGFLKHGYNPLYNLHGIRKFIRKPFNPFLVIRAIEKTLERSGTVDERKKIL